MKKIFKGAFVAALVMAAGYNVYSSRSEAKLSEVMLDNVEALANPENGSGYKYVEPGTDPSVKCVCWQPGNKSCC